MGTSFILRECVHLGKNLNATIIVHLPSVNIHVHDIFEKVLGWGVRRERYMDTSTIHICSNGDKKVE